MTKHWHWLSWKTVLRSGMQNMKFDARMLSRNKNHKRTSGNEHCTAVTPKREQGQMNLNK